MLSLTQTHACLIGITIIWAIIGQYEYCAANRVIELNEKFLEIYPKDSRSWIIKFYAPWCHHCRNLEPIWAQIAQQLHNKDVDIFVGRVDCTRHTAIANHFSVKGFPTILFVNSEKTVEFRGDRTKDEFVDFALRMNGPSVRQISHCNEIESLRQTHSVFFSHFGDEISENFTQIAKKYQSYDWFYQSKRICDNFTNGVYVIKKNNFFAKYDESNPNLEEWIRCHRFPQFNKITNGNMNLYLQSRKLLVIALVEEFKQLGKLLTAKNEEFRELIEAIAYTYSNNDKFIFGWCSDVDTINSIALRMIMPLPNVIILNSTNLQYYLLEDEILPQNLINLLEDLKIDSVKVKALGGDTFWHRLYRLGFDAITSLGTMYHGNPVLTILIFGLPLAFLSVIIYMSCFSDILEANDDDDDDAEEETESHHEKRE